MRKILLVLVPLFVLLSCDPETDTNTRESEAPLCTGFAYRDLNNVYLGSVGVPNNKLTSDVDQKWLMRVYPIPALNNIQIEFDKPGKKTAWITAAEVIDELCTDPVLGEKPALRVGNHALAYGATTENQLNLEIPSLPDGPYRLYLRYDGELFWENIVITDSKIF